MKAKTLWLIVALAVLLILQGSLMVSGQDGASVETPSLPENTASPQDQVLLDNLIVNGSTCVGLDCVSGELFYFDTLRLKENNLRIHFEDTSSSGGFPTTDWRITINDSALGGASYFRIENVSDGINPLTILADGKVGIGIESPTATLHVAGNVLVNGSVTEISDVHAKENITPVDGQAVLAALSQVPVSSWNYIADDPGVRHMGPMAQDFYAAFELGMDERHIASIDTGGVALAAIQALNQQVQEKDAQIAELQQQNADLAARLTALEALVTSLVEE